jgi:selenocysteine lyase/cysteine desulfurase
MRAAGNLEIRSMRERGEMTRRECLAAAAALLASSTVPAGSDARQSLMSPAAFGVKGVYLNNALHHPLPLDTARAMQAYISSRTQAAFATSREGQEFRTRAITMFGSLINASPEELMFVPSTTYGENMLVAALGLTERAGRVVSDVLHFKGSLYQYSRLSNYGLNFVLVPMRDNRIHFEDLDRAITPGTDLVSVSMVSNVNGFAHDLKALCTLAHERGALVYADVIQAVGAVSLDVKETGIDFCACSGFKWLMAESGAGFLYARKDHIPRLKRVLSGYHQIRRFTYHVFPYDSPSQSAFDFEAEAGLEGQLGIGSISNAAIVAMAQSLDIITRLGVETIANHRQPLLRRLESALPAMGAQSMTPAGSTSPVATFIYPNAEERLGTKLMKAGINIELYPNRIRISPSVYNSTDDVDDLIDVLSKA